MVAANVISIEQDVQPVPSKATLYAKLARVMGAMTRIKKTGYNDHFKYPFATQADIADAVRSELAKENVAFLVNMLNVTQETITGTKEWNGKTTTTTTTKTKIVFEFTFACGDTGAVKSCEWESEALDSQDKGINKCATAAVKYFLLETFLISTGDIADDPDQDADLQERGKAQKKADKPQRRVDTSKPDQPMPAPQPEAANGRKEPLFQYLMKHVKHERYESSEARANAINLLMTADLLTDEGNRETLIKRVERYADLRAKGNSENDAMQEIRLQLAAAPSTQEGA